jgi:subtilisin family serine protease
MTMLEKAFGSIGINRVDITDPLFDKQWNLSLMNVRAAWKYTIGEGTTVGIIDSGVDGSHKDLGWEEYIEINAMMGDKQKEDRYRPVMDAIRSGTHKKILPGWNFINNSDYTNDHFRHGTAIAGVIAAERDDFGIVGVAPGAKIRPYVVVDHNGYAAQDVTAAAIMRAADDRCDVINISLAWPYVMNFDVGLQEAVSYANRKGSVVVSAAGNNNTDSVYYPGCLDGVICVGGCNRRGVRWVHNDSIGSNYGERVLCTGPADDQPIDMYMRSRTDVAEGTSLAVANISGLVLLMKSLDKSINCTEVSNMIADCSSLSRVGRSTTEGWGVPDASLILPRVAAGSTSIVSMVNDIVVLTEEMLRVTSTNMDNLNKTLKACEAILGTIPSGHGASNNN